MQHTQHTQHTQQVFPVSKILIFRYKGEKHGHYLYNTSTMKPVEQAHDPFQSSTGRLWALFKLFISISIIAIRVDRSRAFSFTVGPLSIFTTDGDNRADIYVDIDLSCTKNADKDKILIQSCMNENRSFQESFREKVESICHLFVKDKKSLFLSDQRQARSGLCAEVKGTLYSDFGVDAQVSVRDLDYEGGTRHVYEQLLCCPAIEFQVLARLSNHITPVTISCALQVAGIELEGRATFQKRKPSPEDIARVANIVMQDLIDFNTRAQQRWISIERARQLAYEDLPSRLRSLLGVTTRCIGWVRHPGEGDAAWDNYHRQLRTSLMKDLLEQHQDAIKHLQTARALHMAGAHEEAAEVEKAAAQSRYFGSRNEAEVALCVLPETMRVKELSSLSPPLS